MFNCKKIFVFFLIFSIFMYIGYSVYRGTYSIESDMTEVITYEMFGAKGDGITNDYAAIKAAHDYANKKYIDDGILNTVYSCSETDCSDKKYYLGSSNGAGEIKVITNVDWRKANFIVDDYIDSNSDGVNDVAITDNLFAIVSPLRIYANSKSAYVPFLNYDDEVISYLSLNKMIKPNISNLKYLIEAFYDGKIKTSDFYNNNRDEVEKYFRSSQRWAVVITDSSKQYIRKGTNQNSGSYQIETILLDSITGDVLTDINWEYDDIIDIKLYPISDNKITIGNGNFTTYTNNVVYTKDSSGNASRSSYVNRNITLFYSGNVKLHNINHFIDENKHLYTSTYQDVSNGNLYYGFIKLLNSSFVEVFNSKLSAHTPTKLVSNNIFSPYTLNGTYDLIVDNSVNVFLDNISYACNTYNSNGEIDYNSCYKKNIIDENKWGIMASNRSKNMFIVNSKLNRIDAHMGATNLYVADSTIGVGKFLSSMTLIGKGYFYGKNLKIDSADHLIKLRDDYGSTWNGTIVLDDIDYIVNKNSITPSIIYSYNEQNWDFGYNTYFPNVYIKNLNIDTMTKNANNVEYVSFLNLSSLYKNGSTIDKSNSRNLYNFKYDIYLDNLTTNGNNVRLFNKNFVNSDTDTLNINNYGGNNIVNLYLDEDIVVDNKVISHSNPKFKLVDSMNDKMSEVSTFFDDLKKTSSMPLPLKPLISNIKLSDGVLNEEIDSGKFDYTANVDVDIISIELETAYVGTYTTWNNKTINLNEGDNIIQFVVMNSNGDTTNYTLNIIRDIDNIILSDINTLDNIVLNNGNLNETFSKDKNNYTANIDSSTLDVGVIKTDDKSIVTGDVGLINLHYGTNILNIIVTAENGSINRYVIEVYRRYGFSSDKYIYNEEDKYLYTGSDIDKNIILDNVNIPNELSKDIDNNKLVIKYNEMVIDEYVLLNINFNDLNVDNSIIMLDGTMTYDDFVYNIDVSDGIMYKISTGNVVVTNGNITDGMYIRIYYNDEEIDMYNISIYSLVVGSKLDVDEDKKTIISNLYNVLVSDFLKEMMVTGGNIRLEVTSRNGVVKTDNDYIGTGDIFITYVNDVKKDEYTLVVMGDTNGDGMVSSLDLVMLRKHIVKYINPDTSIIETRTGVYEEALDISRDNMVTSLDLVRMRMKIVGLE